MTPRPLITNRPAHVMPSQPPSAIPAAPLAIALALAGLLKVGVAASAHLDNVPVTCGCCECYDLEQTVLKAGETIVKGGSASPSDCPKTSPDEEGQIHLQLHNLPQGPGQNCQDCNETSLQVMLRDSTGRSQEFPVNGITINTWEWSSPLTVTIECHRQNTTERAVCRTFMVCFSGCDQACVTCEGGADDPYGAATPSGGLLESPGDPVRLTIPVGISGFGSSFASLEMRLDSTAHPGRSSVTLQGWKDISYDEDATGLTSVTTQSAHTAIEAMSPLPSADPNAFTVKLHDDPAGSSFRTITVQKLADGTLQASIEAFSKTRVMTWKQDGNTWTFTDGGGMRKVVRTLLSSTDSAQSIRIEDFEQDPQNTSQMPKTSDVIRDYQKIGGAWKIVQQRIDPDGEDLTSIWSYYAVGELTGPSDYLGVARLKHHSRHDGYYEDHVYLANGDSVEHIVTMPYGPGTVTRTTSWNPTNKELTNKELTRSDHYNGVIEIARTVTKFENHKTTVHRHSSGTDKLTTVTEYHQAGSEGKGGRPVKIQHPNQTLTLYDYENDNGDFEITTQTGQPGSGGEIVEGTRRITTINPHGITEKFLETAISEGDGDDVILQEWLVIATDPAGKRPSEIAWFPTSHHGWTIYRTYACCGLASETDQFGILTQYAYDDLGRRIRTNRLDVTHAVEYRGLTVSRYRYHEEVEDSLFTATPSNEISRTVHTSVARTETVSSGPSPQTGTLLELSTITTTYRNPVHASDPNPGNLPSGIGRISLEKVIWCADDDYDEEEDEEIQPAQATSYFFDGTEHRTWGALRPNRESTYLASSQVFFRRVSYLDDSVDPAHGTGGNLKEARSLTLDMLGRVTKETMWGLGEGTRNFYNGYGQLETTIDADDVITLYRYNGKGERVLTAVKLDSEDEITYGTDQITRTETFPAMRGETGVLRSQTHVWLDEAEEEEPTLVSQTDHTPDGRESWSWQIGQGPPPPDEAAKYTHTVTEVHSNTNWFVTTTLPDDSLVEVAYMAGLWQYSWHTSPMYDVSYFLGFAHGGGPMESDGYDSLNRLTHVRDSRTWEVTETEYVSAISDAVAKIKPPGSLLRETTFTYDHRGRRTHVDAPDSPKPGGGSHANVTITRHYPDGNVREVSGDQAYPVTYGYDHAGRMTTMTTHRNSNNPATTKWQYNDHGRLAYKYYDYNATQPGPPAIAYAHTFAGRLQTRNWESGIETTYGYEAGRLDTITYSDDTPGVTREYDALGRVKSETRHNQSRIEYLYDDETFRIDTETVQYDLNGDGTYNITRVLERKSDDIGRDNGWILKQSAGTPEHAASYGYDALGRLNRFHAAATLPAEPDFIYTYEENSPLLVANITAPVHNVDNIWEQHRDILDRKENQNKDLQDGMHSVYDYAVNDFGQRDSVDVTGIAFGSGERDRVWAYDEFGQLVSEADANNTAFSRGYDYDHIGNRIKSIQGDTDTEEPGAISYTPDNLNQYEAIGAFSPSYDDDGNARDWRIWSGGLQTADTLTLQNVVFIWDAENRLIEIQTPSEATLVKYTYDAQSRRIRQQASGQPDTVFFYDGWNLIAEYQVEPAAGTPTPPEWQAVKTATYLWGLDLSGSMQGAGGVGGLLSVTKGTNTYYPTYDGNGNVSEYLDTAGQIAVHYQYDAFGNILHYTEDAADLAKTFRHRFSTKPQDEESGLLYYGYRYYDPVTGRWPSRDPIEERGGINLYGFVYNNGVGRWDYLGLELQINQTEGSLAELGLPAGWFGSTSRPTPDPQGENEVDIECINEGEKRRRYRVFIRASIEYNVTVDSPVANDQINLHYTLSGLNAIREHEQRRVDSITRAYNTYLRVFEADITGMCAEPDLTKLQADRYKETLEKWLRDKQRESLNSFSSYVITQREAITGEDASYLDADGNRWLGSTLFDSIGSPHQLAEAPAIDMSCPN